MEPYDTTLRPRSVVNVKRLQRASRKLDVIPLDPPAGRYMVESESHQGELYEVTLDREGPGGSCTCPWGAHGGVNCKHVLAALRAHYADRGALSFWRSPDEARRQHRRTLAGDDLIATLRPR
jgi:uncharacterized Zn finger protein